MNFMLNLKNYRRLFQEQVIFSDDLVVELWNKHMDKIDTIVRRDMSKIMSLFL